MGKVATCTVLLAVAAALLSDGCAAPPRLEAVSPSLTAKAEIPGMPGVRFVGGSEMTDLLMFAVEALRREEVYRASQGQTGPPPPATHQLANVCRWPGGATPP